MQPKSASKAAQRAASSAATWHHRPVQAVRSCPPIDFRPAACYLRPLAGMDPTAFGARSPRRPRHACGADGVHGTGRCRRVEQRPALALPLLNAASCIHATPVLARLGAATRPGMSDAGRRRPEGWDARNNYVTGCILRPCYYSLHHFQSATALFPRLHSRLVRAPAAMCTAEGHVHRRRLLTRLISFPVFGLGSVPRAVGRIEAGGRPSPQPGLPSTPSAACGTRVKVGCWAST